MASIPDLPAPGGDPAGSGSGGDYDVGVAIREGWGGTIRDGHYRRSGRRVTVEEIRADLTVRPGVVDRLARFGRDAAALRDPHLLAVYDLVADGGAYRLVAEWSDAPTVSERLGREAMSPELGVGIVGDVLAGLGALHAAAMFHGQVCTDTVVVGEDGRARLAELAVCAAAAVPGAGPAGDVRDAARLGLHVLRGAGARLDPIRRRLDAAAASASGDAAALRAELDAIAVAALGAGWRDRRSSPSTSAPRARRRRLVALLLAALVAVAGGVVAAVVLLGNRAATAPAIVPFAIGRDTTLSVTPAAAGCDSTFVFIGRGSLSGAGTLVYRWEQSDGETTAPISLRTRPDEGAFQLTQAWRLQGSQSVDGSMTLHILEPTDRSVRRTFHYQCP